MQALSSEPAPASDTTRWGRSLVADPCYGFEGQSVPEFAHREALRRLDQLEPGHCGIVRAAGEGESDVDLLKSMGVCLGRKVMLIQAGDPLILKVMGTRLGVSSRLAERVLVEPCEGDAFGERL